MGLDLRSLSLRRAWIEIVTQTLIKSQYGGRSPYGERGLKLTGDKHDDLAETSLSLRRAWIEMG